MPVARRRPRPRRSDLSSLSLSLCSLLLLSGVFLNRNDDVVASKKSCLRAKRVAPRQQLVMQPTARFVRFARSPGPRLEGPLASPGPLASRFAIGTHTGTGD
ncbi:hypothetical protein F5148DRAFT_1180424 [Russula earlei]|uniref:Uncharacterized protein n=1 Tax=Russula earlei TaxID=71964 RepID=A0ACC0UF93_9AGAM|nr:hypothetical protein F5148DRAFT_1180424 [Russula earlei]